MRLSELSKIGTLAFGLLKIVLLYRRVAIRANLCKLVRLRVCNDYDPITITID